MSLTNRHSSVMIGLASRLADDSLVLAHEEPTLNNEGWDNLTQIWTTRRAALTPETLATLFPVGARLGSRNWWIVGSVPQEKAPGFWVVTVSYKGWAAAKPTKIVVGSASQQQSAENALAPAFVGDTIGTTYPHLQTQENMPDITAKYLVADITGGANKSALVGTAQTPPISLAVAATVWGTLSLFTYHWPNGWVLMSHQQDRLAGTNAAEVTDVYQFIRDKTPK